MFQETSAPLISVLDISILHDTWSISRSSNYHLPTDKIYIEWTGTVTTGGNPFLDSIKLLSPYLIVGSFLV